MKLLFDDFLNSCQKLRKENKSFVVATLIDKKNSAPQDVGSKIIVCDDGLFWGTIGGGNLERNCIDLACEFLNSKDTKSFFKDFNLAKDFKMICGGSVKVFFEKIESFSSWNITIFGAGHVSQALCKILVNLECNLTCIDTRKQWLDRLPFSENLNKILVDDYEKYVQNISLDNFVLIMTYSHKCDYEVLKKCLQKGKYSYLGVIGSNTKRLKFENDLNKQKIKPDFISPMGEKFDSNNPYEIAISISNELLRYKNNHFS